MKIVRRQIILTVSALLPLAIESETKAEAAQRLAAE